jgi:molybdate transport system regulatory protein
MHNEINFLRENMFSNENEIKNENKFNPVIRINLRLEAKEGIFFGFGAALILENIEQFGSLKKAAEKLGLSYRWAWDKIQKTELLFDKKFIIKRSNKGGYELTEFGKEFKNMYFRWFNNVEDFAYVEANKIFPLIIEKFNAK